MGSRPVGEWSNRSWMHGVAQDRMGLRSMRLVARGRMKPTSFWRAMAGAGGQLLDQGRVVIQFGPTAPPNKFFRCSRQQGDIPETSTPVLLPSFYIAPATDHPCTGASRLKRSFCSSLSEP